MNENTALSCHVLSKNSHDKSHFLDFHTIPNKMLSRQPNLIWLHFTMKLKMRRDSQSPLFRGDVTIVPRSSIGRARRSVHMTLSAACEYPPWHHGGFLSTCIIYPGADPENFSRGGPTLSKKKPITHTWILVIWLLFCGLILFDVYTIPCKAILRVISLCSKVAL